MSTLYSESSQARDSGVNEEIIIETGKTKRKASAVWDHFTKFKGIDNIIRARCNHCARVFSGDGGTTHLKKHLDRTCPNYKPDTSLVGASPRTTFKFDQMKSRRKLAISCIKHKFPFNIGEHEHFEDFLSSLNPNFQLPCRNTIRSDVIDVYREEKVKVQTLLDGLSCKMSLTTDIWTSDHSRVAYCCLTAHFIDDEWELQKKILSFKKIPYPHDGDNLFNFMKENILEWNLDKKIFSVVVDNASSNDSMMRKLREWLLKDSLIPLNGDLLHVRCSAHVLNLIVQDGLSPIRGLIEKIRETVRYLNKSPSATQKFDTALRHCNLEGKRKVTMDDPNRWNSTYLLLETALPLKEAFCRLQRIDGHYQFSPSELEWEVAKIVHDCLKHFYEATHHFSGSKYPTSNVFFPDICTINLKMIEWGNSDHDFVRRMCDPMREKFDKYWDTCCLVLAVAVVFDPQLKMKMVEFFYKKLYGSYADSYIERVRDTLLELFIAYGGSCATQSTIPSSINLETSTSLSEFYMWCNESNASVIPKSELDSYLEEASFQSVEDFSILNWWRTNSLRLPIMAKIARDILVVPATTVASESAFSVGGRVINESRACLHPTAVEALVVADDWIKSTPRNGNGVSSKSSADED
ncbi:hypothetical protein BUALT_Bualt19G0121800 [Buddleja alternifolia]|uniref:BED-type domain-containing protein n=1 Tax=Buddleja alternifolia TaxID=168488 RepID=A0AAV6W6U1_9LAMI|nr:hypothetical protein BUALT_Bualt19G0121800 [Buddleja alternifolia]